ncbi:hypothetical protein FC87_GL000557 [Fructilactobacillus florum DSM 22689 = JCM 16035]|uniref:NADH:flavin oxidoreductase/NADH oxidase N-terminal domain-containing protein n=3 Tax=Fructilactobacillus florum TaxID=640331 RepID=A0A0R2CK56_9LACO|nr:hypothetical protein FC87_GL000557 [Fructilactobacillus florum DSM 22689 = JCM 16035]
MAPLTRSRGNADGTVGDFASIYYAQRATMGLIISEATHVSLSGQGFLNAPGIYSEKQMNSWKPVIQAVHSLGGHMFMQLIHNGRMVHPANTIDNHIGLAPSAIAPENSTAHTVEGRKPYPIPIPMTISDINTVINDFSHSAKMSILAGADGVEVHGANGYLLHQFMGVNSNVRTDEYGGNIENRARLSLEVVKKTCDEIGSQRVGFRISPHGPKDLSIDEGKQIKEFYHYLVNKLNNFNLAYLHVLDYGFENEVINDIVDTYKGTIILNKANRPLDELTEPLESKKADLIAVGHWAISNPDLVYRLQNNKELNKLNYNTLYGGGNVGNLAMPTEGYIDYPTIEDIDVKNI